MESYIKFLSFFEDGAYMGLKDLDYIADHTCGHLIGDWTTYYREYQKKYNYVSKARVFCRWKPQHGL